MADSFIQQDESREIHSRMIKYRIVPKSETEWILWERV